ncbi:hypothetical protein D8802_04485 [Streptococcus oralis]|uniref:Uncharacterized protein n=1 Tax=Streptococcus oralis TaxID=1303 RepID=A0A3R9LJC5_STROR|nr:ABC transporter permease [Streptococcus oralis]RSJ67736.1 hypothetical protein D8802_04485 [Streptococcus oralis]
MKKKPIYLWVLLVLSALISAMSLFGILSPVPSKEALGASQAQVQGISAQQLEDTINYLHKTAELSHSTVNIVLIILSAILVVAGIVLLVRNHLQYANYSYIAYVLLAIVGSIYTYMGMQDAVQAIRDETLRLGTEVLGKGTTILFVVINVLFLAIVFYKMWRQQKDLSEEVETEELA